MPKTDFFQTFLVSETFVIGGDSGGGVFLQTFAAQTGGVAVDGFFAFMGGANLGHYVGIVVQHAGEIHHLGQINDRGIVEQLCHFSGVEHCAGFVERAGRHATRGAEMELQRRALGVVDHVAHARGAAHIGDFVRIAYRRHGAVQHGQACELGGHQHRTFDVHVCIDETGKQERRRRRMRFLRSW